MPLTAREHRAREGRRRAVGDPATPAARVVVGTTEEDGAVAVLGTPEPGSTVDVPARSGGGPALRVAPDEVVPLPPGVAAETAAASLDPLLEALAIVGALGRLRGASVLVTDGTTALGRALVACAARAGAQVTAVLPDPAAGSPPAPARVEDAPSPEEPTTPKGRGPRESESVPSVLQDCATPGDRATPRDRPTPGDRAAPQDRPTPGDRATPGASRSAADVLRDAGAAEVVDARHTPYAVLPQFDVVLTEVDEPGPLHEHHPLHQALAATRRRGTLVPLGAPAPEDAAAKRVRVLPPPPAPTVADLRRAVDALAAGVADPLPPRDFPGADRAAARAALAADGERRGAIVLSWP